MTKDLGKVPWNAINIGNRAGKIQKKYSITKEEADKQIDKRTNKMRE